VLNCVLRVLRRVGLPALVVLAVLAAGSGPVVRAAPCWRPPVAAPVVDPYRQPACKWCPGNRGIEYGTSPGDAVRAVAAGEVTFSGSVAGHAYLVVRHADGMRATYGNLSDRLFVAGDVVARSAIVGHAAGPFHFGLRVGDQYVDPGPLIGRLVGVLRLVPVDGSAPAPAPPPRLACAAAGRSESR
jgi:murein DD-endopeptidase MepM/ murein hydrolase activator NlpD